MSNKIIFISAVIFFFIFVAFNSFGATLYDYYDTEYDDNFAVRGIVWAGQSFTATTTYTMEYGNFLLFRVGNPGTVVAELYLADANDFPTSTVIATTSLDGNTFTTSGSGEWYSFDFADNELTEDVKYTIILKAASGSYPSHYVGWNYDSTSGGYSGGRLVATYDGGSSWTGYSNYDAMFRIYGTISEGGTTTTSTLDYSLVLSIILLGIFIIILIDFLRRLALGI